MTADCGGFGSRNFPIGGDAAEMVDPNDIVKLKDAAEAMDPPGEAAFFVKVPAVEGVAPSLSDGAEIVGWNPCNGGGLTPVIQVKKFGVAPDIGAIMGNENGNIPNDGDAPLFGRTA